MIFQQGSREGDWDSSDLEDGLGDMRRDPRNRRGGERKKVKCLVDKGFGIHFQL